MADDIEDMELDEVKKEAIKRKRAGTTTEEESSGSPERASGASINKYVGKHSHKK